PDSFGGLVDEVEVHDRALSAGEIQAIYEAGSAGKCSGQLCATPPPALVAWYRGENDARDSQGTNHGALKSGATFDTGKIGQALKFDGVDDAVEVPDSAALRPTHLGIDAWVKFDDLDAPGNAGGFNGTQAIVMKRRNNDDANHESY